MRFGYNYSIVIDRIDELGRRIPNKIPVSEDEFEASLRELISKKLGVNVESLTQERMAEFRQNAEGEFLIVKGCDGNSGIISKWDLLTHLAAVTVLASKKLVQVKRE